MARVIRGFSDTTGSLDHAWLVIFPYWVYPQSVAIHLGQPGWHNVVRDVTDLPVAPHDRSARRYLLHRGDSENIQALFAMFPEGQFRLYPAEIPGREFGIYFVPGRPAQNSLEGQVESARGRPVRSARGRPWTCGH